MKIDKLPSDVIEKINEIINLIKEQKLTIFFGSGISVKEPSNLPAGSIKEYENNHAN